MADTKNGRLRLEYRTPAELDDNPENWREHPEAQMLALDQLISDPEIGYAGACLYNQRTKRLIDGHARKKRAIEKGEQLIPVIIGDWSEEAERKILLSLDPVAALAKTNNDKQAALLKQLTESSRLQVQGILDAIKGGSAEQVAQAANPTKLKPIAPAPDYTWCLIGIPTVRFGEIAAKIESLGKVPDILLETLCNNQLPDPGD